VVWEEEIAEAKSSLTFMREVKLMANTWLKRPKRSSYTWREPGD